MMALKTELYEHQQKAVKKLSKIKVGALYMEMGTGKTRTALELIANRYNAGKINNTIWLCPCSVKENLRDDIIKHKVGGGEGIDIYGIESLSQSDRLYMQLLDRVSRGRNYLIVDESSMVKNHTAIRTKRITELASHCPYKLILNGTPISKNEADLYAQWYILDWRILGYRSYWSFKANHLEFDDYGRIRRVLNTGYLSEKIAPYTYQVLKKDCMDLPDKTYDTWNYWLTDEQNRLYEETKNIFLDQVDEFDSTTIYRLFTALQLVVSGNRITCRHPLGHEPLFADPYDNPRIEALLSVLNRISEKTIIWCKYVEEIEDVEKVLKAEYGEDAVAVHYGKIKQKKRDEALRKFRNEARFLIANKDCGGYGLNLQYCSYMVYYSNDFDWQMRAQSEDRIHRIGQQKNVHIIDICAVNKVDERILGNLWRKEKLSDSFKKELALRNNISRWIDGEARHDTNWIESKRQAAGIG